MQSRKSGSRRWKLCHIWGSFFLPRVMKMEPRLHIGAARPCPLLFATIRCLRLELLAGHGGGHLDGFPSPDLELCPTPNALSLPLEMDVATSVFLERGNAEMQDRAEILRFDDRIVFLVADGAGGRSGAAEAAESFVRSASEAASKLNGSEDCVRLLCELDQK